MNCKLQTPHTDPSIICKHYLPGFKNEAGFCNLKYFRCIESLKTHLPTLTQSAAKAYIQCKEKFRLQYILGISCHDSELPLPVKLGATYGDFIGTRASGEPFYISEYKEKYHLWPNDISKLKALFRATRDLNLYPDRAGATAEQHISWNCGDHNISGYTDVSYEDHFREYKLSARPDFYLNKESMFLQCGTYLLGNPEWEWVDIMAVRLPGLKTGKGKNSGEQPGDYESRIYRDILSRPGHYFLGYSKKTGKFGKRFYRGEFDLDYLISFYMNTLKEMRYVIDNKLWTRNELSCHVPTRCWFYPIKRSGVVSEQLYQYNKVEDAMGGMR
jgi:hypothetical protein